MSDGTTNSDQESTSPPLFSSWKGWYLLLLGVLAGLIILFRIFSASFS